MGTTRMKLFASVAAALLLSAGAAGAAMMPDEVSKKVSQQFGVKVLRVISTDLDGRRAFSVRVMSPGGNSNEAFRVDTLMVDAETGQLLRAFRHLPSGYALAGDPAPDTNRNSWSVPADGRVWR
ncbi:MAG: PepSY domain-containing protein [Alphaproteobacteria bacterium]|nr:PepSY domain-containing protein [Alphaproteobacteria bacterium]